MQLYARFLNITSADGSGELVPAKDKLLGR